LEKVLWTFSAVNEGRGLAPKLALN